MDFENLKFWYLSKSSWINPLAIIVLIVGIPVSILYGYDRTQRVWDNLAYINGDQFEHRFDSLLDSDPQIQAIATKKERDSLKQILIKNSRSWPISLLTNNIFDTLETTGSLTINQTTYPYVYSDSLTYDSRVKRFNLAPSIFIKQDSFPQLGQNINQSLRIFSTGILSLDSIYTMSIENWKDTDTLLVKFIPVKPGS